MRSSAPVLKHPDAECYLHIIEIVPIQLMTYSRRLWVKTYELVYKQTAISLVTRQKVQGFCLFTNSAGN